MPWLYRQRTGVTIYSEMLRLALADAGSGTERPISELVAELLSRRPQAASAPGTAGRGAPARVAERIGDVISYDVALVQLCDRLSIEHDLTGGQTGPDERRRAEERLVQRLPSLATALASAPSSTQVRVNPGPGPVSGSGDRRGLMTTEASLEKIPVFLLDDHQVVREGLRSLLEADGGMEVVGEAGTAAEALARIPAVQPRVAVLDVRLPDGTGVEVCREIRSAHPNVACLMLTSFSDDEALVDAIMAGASGYVLKEVGGSDLVGDIRKVAAGHSLLDPTLTSRIMERIRARHEEERQEHLTAQEERILGHIAEGLTNRQIAEAMYLSEKTVKNYVSNLLAKLGMSRRTEAAVYAIRRSEKKS